MVGTAGDGHLVGLARGVGCNGSSSVSAEVGEITLAGEVGAIGLQGRGHGVVLLGSEFVGLGAEGSGLDHLHVGRCEGGTEAKNGENSRVLHGERCVDDISDLAEKVGWFLDAGKRESWEFILWRKSLKSVNNEEEIVD